MLIICSQSTWLLDCISAPARFVEPSFRLGMAFWGWSRSTSGVFNWLKLDRLPPSFGLGVWIILRLKYWGHLSINNLMLFLITCGLKKILTILSKVVSAISTPSTFTYKGDFLPNESETYNSQSNFDIYQHIQHVNWDMFHTLSLTLAIPSIRTAVFEFFIDADLGATYMILKLWNHTLI